MEGQATFSHEYLQREFMDLVREVGMWEALKKVAQYIKGPISSNPAVQGSNLLRSFIRCAGAQMDLILQNVPISWVIQESPVLDDETYYDPTDKGLSRLDLVKPKHKGVKSGKAARRASRNG